MEGIGWVVVKIKVLFETLIKEQSKSDGGDQGLW